MKYICIVLIAVTLLGASLFAQNLPKNQGFVTDTAKIMSENEIKILHDYLLAVQNQTGVELAIVTIPSLEGIPIEDYSMQLAETWKMGDSKLDSGILMLIAVEDRIIRIDIGYGLEGQITDAQAGEIIRTILTPHFRDGNYGAGITSGAVELISRATNGQTIHAPKPAITSPESSNGSVFSLLFFIGFIILMNTGLLRRRGFLLPFFLGTMLSSKNSRNHTNGFGGGGFGSGGGGGFGGFGGGGFGGGGASGRW